MLSDRDRALLEFERQPYKSTGRKETAILETWGFPSTTYYLRLERILDDPDALVYDPQLVNRLRRIRDARRATRGVRA